MSTLHVELVITLISKCFSCVSLLNNNIQHCCEYILDLVRYWLVQNKLSEHCNSELCSPSSMPTSNEMLVVEPSLHGGSTI